MACKAAQLARPIVRLCVRPRTGLTMKIPASGLRPPASGLRRPTDCPSSLTETQSKYCVECYDTYPIHSRYKGAGRHHKRADATFGRATSFVVFFVVEMNRVDVVAPNTIFAFRLSKTGRTVGRTGSRWDGWLVGQTNERLLGQVGLRGSLSFPSSLKRFPTVILGESRTDFRQLSFEKSSSTH